MIFVCSLLFDDINECAASQPVCEGGYTCQNNNGSFDFAMYICVPMGC